MKYGYLIILAVMLAIDVLLFIFCDVFGFQLCAIIFAEIAIYCTLILYEIKKSKAEQEHKQTNQNKLIDVNNDENTQNVEKVDEKSGAQLGGKDGEDKG